MKVTSTTALHLTLNISETVRDRDLVPKDHQQKMALWAIKWSRDRWFQVTSKGAVRQAVRRLS